MPVDGAYFGTVLNNESDQKTTWGCGHGTSDIDFLNFKTLKAPDPKPLDFGLQTLNVKLIFGAWGLKKKIKAWNPPAFFVLGICVYKWTELTKINKRQKYNQTYHNNFDQNIQCSQALKSAFQASLK